MSRGGGTVVLVMTVLVTGCSTVQHELPI